MNVVEKVLFETVEKGRDEGGRPEMITDSRVDRWLCSMGEV